MDVQIFGMPLSSSTKVESICQALLVQPEHQLLLVAMVRQEGSG